MEERGEEKDAEATVSKADVKGVLKLLVDDGSLRSQQGSQQIVPHCNLVVAPGSADNWCCGFQQC